MKMKLKIKEKTIKEPNPDVYCCLKYNLCSMNIA